MKLLCFSDLHCDADAARQLVARAHDADVVIGAGDFANRHRGLEITLDVLREIEIPTVLVPGNGETVDELKAACVDWASATVLHGEGCEIQGRAFWGVGGGIPVTPFGDWSYDFTEEEGSSLLAGCPHDAVLVVHSPPYDTVDRDRSRKVRGSRSARECVLTKRPKLVVCGHIHDDWGKQVDLNGSLVVNAGPKGCLIELDEANA
ncbi:MAG: metallophosphoesterase family protein [Planctomycetota bacterium]